MFQIAYEYSENDMFQIAYEYSEKIDQGYLQLDLT